MTRAFDSCETTLDFSLRLFGVLRDSGVRLGTQQTIACTRAIALLKTVQHDQVLRLYKVTLINRKEDFVHLLRVYGALLEAYLSESPDAEHELNAIKNRSELTVTRRIYAGQSATEDEEESSEIKGYSTYEVDHHQDFRLIPKKEFPAVLLELEKIAKQYATIARRKSKKVRRGRSVDLRASLRQSVKFDGEMLEWRFKRKTPTHTRLVMVVDVSGSMEIYSTFLLNFLYFLHRNPRLKLEVFVFSTYLQHLTEYFRVKNFADMRESVSQHFSGWSGGTKIGQAIAVLNDSFSSTVNAKTSVVIMSDGWDTGESALLDCEMAKLARRAKAVIWINPLKGDQSYEPLASGMATARPYCDEFISGHSVDSLTTFASLMHA